MPRRRDRQMTVVEVAIRRVGFRRGRRALTFCACWWITTKGQGGDPPDKIEDYAEWWAQSRATAFRDQADFRDAFPEFSTPTELAAAIGFDLSAITTDHPEAVVHQMMGWAAP